MQFRFASGESVRVGESQRAGAQRYLAFTGVIDELKVIPKETHMPWGVTSRPMPGYMVRLTAAPDGTTNNVPRAPQPFYEEELEGIS